MVEGYNNKKGITYHNRYHIIFCPKYRRKVLTGKVKDELKALLYEIAKENEVEIKELEVMSDQVHLLISFNPRIHLHKVIQQFKGKTSRILRDKYPELKSRIPSLWTRSYFCCTVGHISEEIIMKYIEEQKHV